ncbi:hypothetical protein ACNOYE_12295 [Nannocystaceae bacterium ST9]
MTITKSRLPILTLLALLAPLVAAPQASHAGKLDDLPVPDASNAVRASSPEVCNESALHFLVDEDRDYVYLWRPSTTIGVPGRWWRLEEHVLAVGYGTSLTTVTHHFSVLQSGSWALDVLGPNAEVPTSIPSSATGLMSYALGRPGAGPIESYEFTIVQPPTFAGLGEGPSKITPATLPDLVIEPQTGCPEDNGTILGPIDN